MTQNTSVEGRLVLSGALTLQFAEAIHAQLLTTNDQPVVEIDCSAATEVDLSFVQLMLSGRAGARKSGRTFRLAHPAAGVLREALIRGGFLNPDSEQPNSDQAFWLEAAGA